MPPEGNRKPGRWRDVALIIALASVLAALGALGIGVLSTWDVAVAPVPASKGAEAGRSKAVLGRPAGSVASE